MELLTINIYIYGIIQYLFSPGGVLVSTGMAGVKRSMSGIEI